jgi:hypothetical protein
VNVSALESITSSADNLWNTVSAPTANANVTIATTGLLFGDYKLYGLDQAGNLSPLDTETARYWPNEVRITYNANTPTTGTAPPQTITQETNTVTLATNVNSMVKTGFTLVGWNTSISGGAGTRLLLGERYNATTNITLYAEWIAMCVPVTSYANNQLIHSFTGVDTCAWTVPVGQTSIDFMVVGGGGGGGGNAGTGGSGGGTNVQDNISISSGQIVI